MSKSLQEFVAGYFTPPVVACGGPGSGRHAEGGHVNYQSHAAFAHEASANAFKASAKAIQNPSKENAMRATNAHDHAASSHGLAGNYKSGDQALHQNLSDVHTTMAGVHRADYIKKGG